MVYPYSYPVPSVFFRPSNAGNVGYYPENDFLQPQYIVQSPQMPTIQPQILTSQPAPSAPVIPLSTVVQSEVNQPTSFPTPQSGEQHFHTVVQNPIMVSQNDPQNLAPNLIDPQSGLSSVQNDQQNYQQGFERPPVS